MTIQDLIVNEYYIHINYGVGIYLENRISNDKLYAVFQYAKGKEMYIEDKYIDKFIRKYDNNGKEVKLDDLKENNSWQKKKAKALEQIKENARGLMQVQAERSITKGFQFSKDTDLQKQFESLCPYELTTGQQQSLDEIKKDMESDKATNRLLLGDVGAGKTEVAIRLVFKAIQDGKQAIVLAPTSVLARQHYNDFCDRYKDFNINVVFLCSATKTKERRRILEGIKDGTTNVIIGTHSVLSDKIEYKNVGLFVVDEEQKFGTMTKEKIKRLQVNIDYLSMSATPIPRTTEQSLVGISNVSKINTYPAVKKPIETEIIEQSDKEIIKKVIQKELDRNGQIYFVENNIEQLSVIKDKLIELIPNLKVGILNGKMKNIEINSIMRNFADRKFDVLISTTIIEIGINVKNANTIIINNANRFGLSQLQQLRGRTGRGKNEGYCYLIKSNNITSDGIRRLKIIKENNALGDGEKIAEKDLAMRGMGELTGVKQHGMQYAIGYDYYMELLKEEVEKLKMLKNNNESFAV